MSDSNKLYNEIVFGHLHSDKIRNADETGSDLEREIRSIKEAALNRAWDTRNFEIELYWKRALYFWGFIALAFAGYFSSNGRLISLSIACAGLFFSIAWFLVNKASKFWQENWESHIDFLESSLEGQLYKTVIKNKSSVLNPLQGHHFSVSKINQLANLFIIIVWAGIAAKEQSIFDLSLPGMHLSTEKSLLVFTALAIICLLAFGHTSFSSGEFKNLGKSKYKYLRRATKKSNHISWKRIWRRILRRST